jgi:hypothetical protein
VTLSRRSFSFASIAALFGSATSARAATPDAAQQQVQGIPELDAEVAPAPPSARVRATIAHVGRELQLRLVLKNEGAEGLPVLVARGSSLPGSPTLTAVVSGREVELDRVYPEVDRREMMSRMGPMPKWVQLASGAEVEIGPYRYSWPSGATLPVHASGVVEAGHQDVPWSAPGLTWATKAS